MLIGRLALGWVVSFGLVSVAVGCGGDSAKRDSAYDDTTSTGTNGSGGGSSGTSSSSGSGGGVSFTTGGSTGGADDSGVRMTKVDDAGQETCFNISSIGQPAAYGATARDTKDLIDSTASFEQWLNTKSSATATFTTSRQKLTPDWLKKLDVLIVQGLMDNIKEGTGIWNYDPSEIDALTQWVNDGGGLITLQGYSPSKAEINPVNQLLAFCGISYRDDDLFTSSSVGDCAAGANSLTGWDPSDPISANITTEPIFHGRSIIAPADATVVVKTVAGALAVHKQVGKGRVFAFADEWVTYSSQWGAPLPQNLKMGDSCYMKGASQIFQVPQFWYNVIKWVSGSKECFHIMDPGVVN